MSLTRYLRRELAHRQACDGPSGQRRGRSGDQAEVRGTADRDTILSVLHEEPRRLNVVDAGVVVEPISLDLDPDRLGDEELAAPHLIDSEVTQVLRGLVIRC